MHWCLRVLNRWSEKSGPNGPLRLLTNPTFLRWGLFLSRDSRLSGMSECKPESEVGDEVREQGKAWFWG